MTFNRFLMSMSSSQVMFFIFCAPIPLQKYRQITTKLYFNQQSDGNKPLLMRMHFVSSRHFLASNTRNCILKVNNKDSRQNELFLKRSEKFRKILRKTSVPETLFNEVLRQFLTILLKEETPCTCRSS